jgi:hypothetical protein
MKLKRNINPVAHLSVLVVLVCSFRFLLDGISVTIFGHSLSVGHTDPLAYSSLLAPLLGAHGYIHTRVKNEPNE